MKNPGTELVPAALALRDVSIRHEGASTRTPDAVTLELAPGEVLLVLGPSGCGKSTLALALNGLVPHVVPASLDGSVLVGGHDTAGARVAELSTRVGMVFQDPDAQIVTGSVLDEVCFGPENLLVPADDVLARAERALRAVGLWERRGDDPAILSGGGRQRLAIACALAMDAPILVLDEPTANLDPAGKEEVYAVLRSLMGAAENDGTGTADQAGGRSIVLIEHDLDTAIDLVDTVAVLDAHGRLVAHGPVGEVLRDRATELLELGVWLPTATLAALRFHAAGVRIDPLPLTPGELASSLDAVESLPSPTHAGVRPGPGSTQNTPAPVAMTVRGLSIALGRRDARREVLRAVSLEVGAGDFLAIVGANGAGKTTLAQAIGGVVRSPRGTVDLGGLDPARASVSAVASRVGYVFQNPEHQFVTDSVTEELAYSLRAARLPEAEISRRVESMLQTLALDDHRDAHPFRLSGGQKRRLSVGTALITGAPLLVLDEPTFGQDRARAVELLDLLSGLNASGTTVVIVTHDLQAVAEHASHVALLADGEVAAFGRTADVLSDTAVVEAAGMRRPPLARAFAALENHPEWRDVIRLGDIPEGEQ